jgi:hypothetical protein
MSVDQLRYGEMNISDSILLLWLVVRKSTAP